MEQQLWNYEYIDQSAFSVQRFIEQLQHIKHIFKNLFNQYPGYFAYLCRECFLQNPSCLSHQRQDNPQLCQNPMSPHMWNQVPFLVHVDARNFEVSPIEEAPQIQPNCLYRKCRHQYCTHRGTTCKFAHSEVELDVWELEHSSHFTRDELVENSFRYNQNVIRKQQTSEQSNQRQRTSTTSGAPSIASGDAEYRNMRPNATYLNGSCSDASSITDSGHMLQMPTDRCFNGICSLYSILLLVGYDKQDDMELNKFSIMF